MTDRLDPYRPPASSEGDPPPRAGMGGGAVADAVVKLLAETRPWVKFISVLIFVGLALVALFAVGFGLLAPKGPGSASGLAFVPMLLVMLLYVPPALSLWRYAASIRRLQAGEGQPALEAALRSQKSFWKYVGIFAIVMTALYLVLIPVAIATGFFSQRP